MVRTQNTSKSDTSKKLAAKKPLQDVTDRYKPLYSTVDRPTPKPNTTLGPTRHILPSSLPPSSPLSASSRPLIDLVNRHVPPMSLSAPENLESEFNDEPGVGGAHSIHSHVGQVTRHTQTMSSSAAENLDSNFDEHGPDIAAGEFGVNSYVDSDPFGFLALENKLKTFRSHQQVEPRFRTILTTPSTPSKKGDERKAIRSPIVSGSEPSSMSSTLSLMPISRKGKKRMDAEEKPILEAELDNNTLATPATSLKTNSRQRHPKGVSGTKESGNPSKKSTLRQTGAAAKFRKGASHGRMRDEGRNVTTVAEAVGKATRQKPRVKRTARSPIDANSDVEKWEQERQARLDYFKKLEDYQLEKENVYVV
ncbi:hypothetical protein C0995_013261 [Termitomyces sp. Mi166|nr:hypothetical protein C0995_013261 [Termitomyces sp. Mi166\